ncbi:MAG TPA: primosomal protein N' [Planctomycetes bacterium]|nr:primosomal protein N' [Planctomycetota bacterium]
MAVARPVDQLFTYEAPEELGDRIVPGAVVAVPFGRSTARGIVIGPSGPPPAGIAGKRIRSVLPEEPLLTEELLRLFAWVSRYYGCPLGEAIASSVPLGKSTGRPHVVAKPAVSIDVLRGQVEARGARAPAQARILAQLIGAAGGVSRAALLSTARARGGALSALVGAGLVILEAEEEPAPCRDPDEIERPQALLPAQAAAVAAICEAIDSRAFRPFLLFGVTGSGKTEVYLQAMAHAAAQGGQGLVLLPEIALTPQTYRRFQARFPGTVLVHSLLPDRERVRNLLLAKRGRAAVVIGARSAVFAPFANLRLIVVDEEHESSFKQENPPRCHARDVAVYRAREAGIPVVLGSATPSLESYHNAQQGRYRMLRLPSRATPRGTPAVRVVDVSRARSGASSVSGELADITANVLRTGRQAIYFLNRRGFAPVVKCVRCGYVFLCAQCSVGLTHHQRGELLLCHTCGTAVPRPAACPQCGAGLIKLLGAGTERIVDELRRRFPSARVGRLDRDIASSRESLLGALRDFAEGRTDIIVGTQMIAKGHDFPEVTLVGIICADSSLYMADFRAAERTFQLIHQVAGRAGRGEEPGTVVIQTFSPENKVIGLAVSGDYEHFAAQELALRAPLRYPPFGRLLRIVVQGAREDAVAAAAGACAAALEGAPCRVLGPAPCPIAKVRRRMRHHLVVKAQGPAEIQEALRRLKRVKCARGAAIAWDVDPIGFF